MQTSNRTIGPPPGTPQVKVRNLLKRYRTKRGEVLALNDVSLDIGKSERVVLLGPSGCGKTTLLRCVAGLEQPDDGEIEINGTLVFSARRGIFVPPEERGISMMFQSYALWPHMTVADNVAYPLENRRGLSKKTISERVDAALAMVACDGLQKRYPAQLSGGQQQRVALARATIANDGLALFDEPLSNVDAKVREQLRFELVTLQRKLGFAWLYVTHDQTEATAVADRVAVLGSGQIAQLGTPTQIYNEPASTYVAEFMGSSNMIKGIVAGLDTGMVLVDTDIGTIRVQSQGVTDRGLPVRAMFRPEQLQLWNASSGNEVNVFQGKLEASMFLGNCSEHVVRIGPHRLVARSLDSYAPTSQEAVAMRIRPEHIRLFPDEI